MKTTDAQKLQECLNGIPMGEYKETIAQLVAGCKVTPATFNNWRYGLCRIPELAKDKIEEILEKEIFKIESHE